MEVDEACVGCPAGEGGARVVLAAGRGEKTSQALEGTDVAPREDVQPSERPQEDVVSAPGPDAAQPDEPLDDRRVVQLLQRFELELPGGRDTSEPQDRLGLALAEAEFAKGGFGQAKDV